MSLPARISLPHAIPSWVSDGAVYFITINAAVRGSNVFCQPEVSEEIFASIEFNRHRGVWWPHLVLLMPDHLHGLFSFSLETGMKKAITDWKHYVSRVHGLEFQRDFFDHRLRADEQLDEKASYIRQNPVRAGLADKVSEWPYVREWRTRMAVA